MKPETTQCGQHEELLDYLYEEMPSQQQAAFARHLDACAHCVTELQGLRRLRADLRAWDVATAPAMEIVIPRSPWQALKECLTLFPVWGRGAFALSGAAAMLLMAFGVDSLLRGANGVALNPVAVAVQTPAVAPAAITPTVSSTPEMKTQVEAQISAAVAQAVAQSIGQERQTLRAQLAGFEARSAEQQMRVQAVARQLRELQARNDALLAETQPSLRRMMADAGDATTNER